jgi:hypothetical protein
MKIEIDLDNIFRDEDGNPEEGLEESIRRQVIERMTGDLRKRLFSQMDVQLSEIMREQIGEAMKTQMPSMIDDIMNATYTPVSSYGAKSEPTTFRKEIIESIAKNMVYKPSKYSSEENPFTRAVKSVVEAKTNAIKAELLKEVDTKFRADAIGFAVTELSKRLGLTK